MGVFQSIPFPLMQRSLNIQFLIRDIIWRLSPHILLRLTQNFSRILPDTFQALLTEDILILSHHRQFDNIPSPAVDALHKLQHTFIHALSSLRSGSPEAERVMIISHLLGMASHDSVRSLLSDILSDDDLSTPLQDYIISVYLQHGLDPIRLALRMNLSRRPRMFNYFVPGDAFLSLEPSPSPLCPDDARLHALRTQLSRYFQEKFHSPMCEISFGLHSHRFFLSITHAGPYRQDRRTHHDRPDNFVFQPVEYDTIVFDLLTYDLCIHMENEKPGVIREYIRSAGELFFEQKAFWGNEQKFSLNPLQHATASSLVSLLDPERASTFIRIPGGQLISIRLTEIVYRRSSPRGGASEHRARNTHCLSRELRHEEAPLIPDGFILTSARFAFDYRTSEGKRKTARLSLTSHRKKVQQSPGSSDELEGIEAWLTQSGFIHKINASANQLPGWFREMSQNNHTLMSPRRVEETILDAAGTPPGVTPGTQPVSESWTTEDHENELFAAEENMPSFPF